MTAYRFEGPYEVMYPAIQDAEGASLIAVPGVTVADWAGEPPANWVPVEDGMAQDARLEPPHQTEPGVLPGPLPVGPGDRPILPPEPVPAPPPEPQGEPVPLPKPPDPPHEPGPVVPEPAPRPAWAFGGLPQMRVPPQA